jgi:transposase-like protein
MTNVIEPLNFSLRKIIKGRSAFPNDDSVYRSIYLGLERISRKWTMQIKNWKVAAATVSDPLRRSLTVRSALASLKLDRDEFRLHKNSDTLK